MSERQGWGSSWSEGTAAQKPAALRASSPAARRGRSSLQVSPCLTGQSDRGGVGSGKPPSTCQKFSFLLSIQQPLQHSFIQQTPMAYCVPV